MNDRIVISLTIVTVLPARLWLGRWQWRCCRRGQRVAGTNACRWRARGAARHGVHIVICSPMQRGRWRAAHRMTTAPWWCRRHLHSCGAGPTRFSCCLGAAVGCGCAEGARRRTLVFLLVSTILLSHTFERAGRVLSAVAERLTQREQLSRGNS